MGIKLDAPARCKPGDLWLLGPHRLLCSDAASAASTYQLTGGHPAHLVATSPPYDQQRTYELDWFDWCKTVPPALLNAGRWLHPRGSMLVNLGLVHRERQVVRYWDILLERMERQGWPLFGWYVWDKGFGRPGQAQGRLSQAHEWVFHFAKDPVGPHKVERTRRPGETASTGLRMRSGRMREKVRRVIGDYKVPDSVIRALPCLSNTERTGHPAQYSLAFAEKLILPYTLPGQTVYDPFGGSGTTLFACEQHGRVCQMMEISPGYCDVILQRWDADSSRPPAVRAQEDVVLDMAA